MPRHNGQLPILSSHFPVFTGPPSTYLVVNYHCNSRLLSQVPPIPSAVNRPLSSTPTNHTRRSARSAIADPETIPFPDDLSDFPTNHGLDEDFPPDPSEIAVHSVPALRPLFQIPSEIKEFALNLNLLPGGNDSEDEYEEEFDQPIFAETPQSLAVAPLAADPISFQNNVKQHFSVWQNTIWKKQNKDEQWARALL